MKTGWGQHIRLIAAHREVDVVGAGLLCVAGEIESWYSLDPSATPGQRVVLTVVVASATLSLAWRRQAPVAVLAVVFGSVVVGVLSNTFDDGEGSLSVFLAVLVAVILVRRIRPSAPPDRDRGGGLVHLVRCRGSPRPAH